jgi:hypothetical protein
VSERTAYWHHDEMELVTIEARVAIIKLSRTELIALINICNNSASGLFEAPERQMAARRRGAALDRYDRTGHQRTSCYRYSRSFTVNQFRRNWAMREPWCTAESSLSPLQSPWHC